MNLNIGLIALFFISIGYYLSLAFYHLVIYFGRKSDKTNLFYSLVLLSLALVIAIKGIYINLPGDKTQFTPYLSFLSFSLSSLTLMVFTNIALTANRFSRETKYFVIVSVAVCTISSLIFHPAEQYSLTISSTVFTMGPVAFLFASRMTLYFFKNEKKLYKEQWRMWIFYGLLAYSITLFIAMPMKVLNVQDYIQAFILNIGAFILSTLSAFSLAIRFNNEHRELAETKRSLEKRIIERTKDLQEAKDLIESQSKEKTTYFINLAHETRTPASLIQNYLDKCLLRYPDDSDLFIVKKNIDKLVNDMVNFLDAEKIEQGRLSYENNHRFNLSEFLNNKAELITPAAESRGIRVSRFIEDNVQITSDLYAFERILNNLLDNAIRYTKKRW